MDVEYYVPFKTNLHDIFHLMQNLAERKDDREYGFIFFSHIDDYSIFRTPVKVGNDSMICLPSDHNLKWINKGFFPYMFHTHPARPVPKFSLADLNVQLANFYAGSFVAVKKQVDFYTQILMSEMGNTSNIYFVNSIDLFVDQIFDLQFRYNSNQAIGVNGRFIKHTLDIAYVMGEISLELIKDKARIWHNNMVKNS